MPATLYNALDVPAFRRFQLARIFMVLAQQIMGVALGWQAYALNDDAMDLAWVGLAQFLPTFLLFPVIGAAIDRFDRRNLLAACWVVISFGIVGLGAVDWWGSKAVWPLLLLSGVVGLARAFSAPTSQSILPELVPSTHFPNALTWSSSVFQLGAIAGPWIGGMVYLALGAAWKVHLVAAACALGGTLAALALPAAGPATTERNRGGALDGLRFVWSRPDMLAALWLDLVAVMFGGVVALLPIYAKEVLGGGPETLGLLRAAPAAGAAAMALWIGRHPIQRRAGALMLGSVVIFGVATIVFALSTTVALSVVALAVAGAADEVSVVIRHCIVQLRTPNEMRGRVSAVNWLFVSVSNELGQFESGVAATLFGLVPAAVLGGVVAIVSAGVAAVWSPALREVDELR
ncbi:MAG: MFS transporter [Myxococcales bacterium]|nr:MFS transporter [Myxococcales bacterium]